MAVPLRFCSNHPQRAAIGVCVVTHKPMCGECSTRYEGVNYSKEGLRLLQQQRAAETGKRRGVGRLMAAAFAWLVSPVLLYLMYLGFLATANVLMSLLHHEL